MSVEAIHVAAVDGAPVRFYRPPPQADGPSFAWVDDRDLVAALTRCGMPAQALFAGISEEDPVSYTHLAGDRQMTLPPT